MYGWSVRPVRGQYRPTLYVGRAGVADTAVGHKLRRLPPSMTCAPCGDVNGNPGQWGPGLCTPPVDDVCPVWGGGGCQREEASARVVRVPHVGQGFRVTTVPGVG